MSFKISHNKNLKIQKYSVQNLKNGIQTKEWIKGVSEIKDFSISNILDHYLVEQELE